MYKKTEAIVIAGVFLFINPNSISSYYFWYVMFIVYEWEKKIGKLEWEVDNEIKSVIKTQNSWNKEIHFKDFQPWHLWSSRGTHTLSHKHLGSLAGHSLDPKTPAHAPLPGTPVDCLHLSDKDIQSHSVLVSIIQSSIAVDTVFFLILTWHWSIK